MQKFMCNVCGKLHDLFNEAALCHPDVVIKEFPDLPVRDAQLRIGADEAGQGGASHTEDDVVTVGRVQDEWRIWL